MLFEFAIRSSFLLAELKLQNSIINRWPKTPKKKQFWENNFPSSLHPTLLLEYHLNLSFSLIAIEAISTHIRLHSRGEIFFGDIFFFFFRNSILSLFFLFHSYCNEIFLWKEREKNSHSKNKYAKKIHQKKKKKEKWNEKNWNE